MLVFTVILYFDCRAPNPDTVLVIQTPSGVFSTKSLIQNKKKGGSRLISSTRIKLDEEPIAQSSEIDSFSAARCRVYKRSINYKKVSISVILLSVI